MLAEMKKKYSRKGLPGISRRQSKNLPRGRRTGTISPYEQGCTTIYL
jgi:hypothetical protein